MIKIGGIIGALNTVSLIFLTAIIGIYFARQQGIQTIKNGLANLYKNELPVYEIISGASIAIAALLLIVPGFLTDLIGFLLLIPLSRKLLIMIFLSKKKNEKNKNSEILDGEVIEDKKKDEL
tara:strand:- start:49 stop:414 length:366 start_codon:yes stop_codon:yes gene_type:complete